MKPVFETLTATALSSDRIFPSYLYIVHIDSYDFGLHIERTSLRKFDSRHLLDAHIVEHSNIISHLFIDSSSTWNRTFVDDVFPLELLFNTLVSLRSSCVSIDTLNGYHSYIKPTTRISCVWFGLFRFGCVSSAYCTLHVLLLLRLKILTDADAITIEFDLFLMRFRCLIFLDLYINICYVVTQTTMRTIWSRKKCSQQEPTCIFLLIKRKWYWLCLMFL